MQGRIHPLVSSAFSVSPMVRILKRGMLSLQDGSPYAIHSLDR